jgi:hypothetical protein
MPDIQTPSGTALKITLPINADVNIIDGQPLVIIPTSAAPIVSITQPTANVLVQMGETPVNVQSISNPIMLPITATDPLPIPGPVGPAGPIGATGPAGPQGPPGHSSDDAPYKWSTATTASDPGSGDIKCNNATPASATHIYASTFDQTATGVFGLFQLLDGSDLYLYESGATGNSIHFKVVGTPVNNGPNLWFDVTVSLVISNGFSPNNNQAVQLYLPVQGAVGPPGPPGVLQSIWAEIPNGTIDGVNRNYTSNNVYTAGLLGVYLNGMRLRPAFDYTETGNQSFQLLSAPLSGDSLSIDYIQPSS